MTMPSSARLAARGRSLVGRARGSCGYRTRKGDECDVVTSGRSHDAVRCRNPLAPCGLGRHGPDPRLTARVPPSLTLLDVAHDYAVVVPPSSPWQKSGGSRARVLRIPYKEGR